MFLSVPDICGVGLGIGPKMAPTNVAPKRCVDQTRGNQRWTKSAAQNAATFLVHYFGPNTIYFWSPHHQFLVPTFEKCDRTFNFLWKRQFLPITQLWSQTNKLFGPRFWSHKLGPTRQLFGPRCLPHFWSHTPRFWVHAFWSRKLGTQTLVPTHYIFGPATLFLVPTNLFASCSCFTQVRCSHCV